MQNKGKTEQADSQQHVADSGETGDGGRCPGGKQGPIDLEYAPDSKQDHRHDKTGVVENIEPAESLFRRQSRKHPDKQRQDQKHSHAQCQQMRVHGAQGGKSFKSHELCEFTVKYPGNQSQDHVHKGSIDHFLHDVSPFTRTNG